VVRLLRSREVSRESEGLSLSVTRVAALSGQKVVSPLLRNSRKLNAGYAETEGRGGERRRGR
jgi:hypothetical protein